MSCNQVQKLYFQMASLRENSQLAGTHATEYTIAPISNGTVHNIFSLLRYKYRQNHIKCC